MKLIIEITLDAALEIKSLPNLIWWRINSIIVAKSMRHFKLSAKYSPFKIMPFRNVNQDLQFIRYSRRFFPLLSPIFWRHSRGITTAIRKMFTLLSYLAKVFFCVCLYVMFLERCESRCREDKVASPPRQDMHIRKRWNKRESKVKSVAVARTCLTTRDSHLLDV